MKTLLILAALVASTVAQAADTRDLLTPAEQATYDASAAKSDELVKALATRANAVVDNSAEVTALKAQVAQLQQVNNALRAQTTTLTAERDAALAAKTKAEAATAAAVKSYNELLAALKALLP